MGKKEFKAGEVFQFGLVKLKVEKAPCEGREGCHNCFLYPRDICEFMSEFVGECESQNREDKIDVIFVKVEN